MVEKIFEYGACAPSSHNAQMWRIVKENENLYRVEMDSLWRLKAVDPRNREAYISIGCFLQNCIYAAPHYGVTTETSVKDTKAYLTFSKCNAEKGFSEYSLHDIERRRTCRQNFLNKPIPDAIIQKLTCFENVKYVDKRTDKGRELSRLIVNSNRVQFSSERSMEELSSFISLNKDDIKRGRGLTLESLGLNSIERFFFRMLYAKKNFAGNKSFFSSSIRATKKQVENCSGFFIIFAQRDSPEELIKTGMQLEHFWLKLTAMGISVHPMSQPLEEVPDEVAHMFPNSGIPEMILRVGYCKKEFPSQKLRKRIEVHPD